MTRADSIQNIPTLARVILSPSVTKTMRSRPTDVILKLQFSEMGSLSESITEVASMEVNTDVSKAPSNLHQSPHRRYLSSFRKLASSSGVIPSIFPCKSYSTFLDFSSEDSTSLVMLPDHANTDYSETGQPPPFDAGVGQMLGMRSSSRKNTGLDRTSSFAERIWKWGQKKSSASASEAPSGTCLILFAL
jgi:hypothetical protein